MASTLTFNTMLRNTMANSMSGVTPDYLLTWNNADVVIMDSSNNVLVHMLAPSTAFSAAVVGVCSKAGTWSSPVILSGTAAKFSMTSSGEVYVITGSVGVTADTPDMVLDNKVLVAGGTLVISTFTITQPA